MDIIVSSIKGIWESSGFAVLVEKLDWQSLVMIILACVLLYLGIKKKFEPLVVGRYCGWYVTYQSAHPGR